MRRALFFFLKLAIVIAVAVWLVERPGSVAIEWGGYLVETSTGVLILLVGLLVVLAALGYRLRHGVLRAPGRMRQKRHAARREKGYRALTQGMVAVAAGDAEAAQRYARRADILLHEPPLTMLLSAQAAQLNGDQEAARRYFEAMLKRPETEFLGLRGLLNQSLRTDDPARALALAHRARALKPKTPWVLHTCMDLEIRQGRWGDALRTLDDAVRARVIDPERGRRLRASMLVERSRAAEGKGDLRAAAEFVHTATQLLPDFVPAVVREASLLDRAGKRKAAVKLIERGWEREPHPDLVRLYNALGPADEDALARVKRLERLNSLRPDHPDGLTALAEAELAAQLWGSARTHLLKVEAVRPSRRVYQLLADLEQSEHGDSAAARNWLAKASSADPEPAWTCTDCGAAAEIWTGLCGNCGSFGTLSWRVPHGTIRLSPVPRPVTLPARADPAAQDRQFPVAPAAGGATAS